ncbi:MAG: hypothetical protein KBD52_00765 [Candidatus Pacebacteria bacterium]|nr:hypothetical protein [Candidatus Paceibacterota bacterium]
MRKPFLKIVLVVFVFFVSYQVVSAFPFMPFNLPSFFPKFVGGVIYNVYSIAESPEIVAAEYNGYDCETEGGSTIQIKSSAMSPETVTYYVSSSTTPVTNTTPTTGQNILGKAIGEKVIVCTRDETDTSNGFLGLGENKPLNYRIEIKFPEINYFGTSRSSVKTI